MSPSGDPRGDTLRAYCRLFETLSPERLDALRPLCTPDIHFVDPFQDIVGIDRYVALYAHMFRSVADPRFEILDQAVGNDAGFIRWRFTGVIRGHRLAIDGTSEVRFDAEGARIAWHVDHWDAAGQVYARLPLIGGLIRSLRRLFAAGV